MDLILDVKIYIASFDEDVWFKLVLVDEEFKCYAYKNLKQFVDLFTRVITKTSETNTFLLGNLHSINDEPATIGPNYKIWYYNDKNHRNNDLPASIYGESKCWYNMGLVHRDNDLPASIYGESKCWYNMGLVHRDNDLPAFIHKNGDKHWWYNNERHRENNLPAVICSNGTKQWWIHGSQYYI